MNERAALYAAICENPEDITARLVFADWLDEQPKPQVNCPRCNAGVTRYDGITRCPDCNGTVPDTSDADLAEFIRISCRISEIRQWCSCGLCVKTRGGGQHTNGGCACDRRQDDGVYLRRRERELLDLRSDRWRRAECPGCGGTGNEDVQKIGYDPLRCRTCGGRGNLFAAGGDSPHDGKNFPRAVTFRNGFPDSVSCELRELGEERMMDCRTCVGRSEIMAKITSPRPRGWESCGYRGCNGRTRPQFVPSAWAEAVVRTTPVTKFVLIDAPFDLAPDRYEWRLTRNGDLMPQALEDELFGHAFSTAGAATLALSEAAGRVVRSAVR